MIDLLNYAFVALSIFFGAFGWLAPGYTMAKVDLADTGSTMGRSEVRAASGALFVGVGIGALLLATPEAYAMIGFAWGGAAIGRATSLIADGRTRLKWIFFASEAAVGLLALAINL